MMCYTIWYEVSITVGFISGEHYKKKYNMNVFKLIKFVFKQNNVS